MWQPSAEGSFIRIEREEVIRSYAGICVQPVPGLSAGDMVDALDLEDTLALRDAVLRFFIQAQGGSA